VARLLLESGDYLLLEDGSSDLLLEALVISPDAIVCTTAVVAPSFVMGAISIIPPEIAVVTTVVEPTLINDTLTLTPDAITVTSSIVAPDVVASGTVTIVPDAVTSTVTVIAASLGGELILTVPEIDVVTTVVAPSVVNVTTITPPAVTAVTAVVAPSFTLGTLTIVPDAVSSATTVVAPDVLTGEILTPDALVITTTVVAPSLTVGDVTLTPDAIVVTVTVVAPSISNVTTFTPGVVTAVTQVVAPTISYGAYTFTPDAVLATTSVVAPSVSVTGETVITVDVITVVTTVVAPDMQFVSRFEPDVITVLTEVIPPTLTIGDPAYTYSATGRQQIVVDQQQGGEKYPFLDPSDNLSLLIGDLYLNYSDEGCEFEMPMCVKWLHGFGTEAAVDPSDSPHAYDMLIVDANDETVFDSRDVESYTVTGWGVDDSMRVIEWVDADGQILRVVVYVDWNLDTEPMDWPVYFEPENACLDGRTLEAIPKHVKQFAIVTDLSDPDEDELIDTGTNVVFEGGYNSQLNQLEDEEVELNADGLPAIRLIEVEFEAGLGLGRFPCEPESLIKQINGVGPDARGNIILDATGCKRIHRPITPSETPSEADVDLATLVASSDCGPCCDCQDFINVYEAIRRLDARYRELGQRAEAVRDQFRANRERWNSGLTCRQDNNIQSVAEAFPECRVAFGVGICNSSDSPMMNVRLRILFIYGPDENGVEAASTIEGCITCNSTARRGNTIPGSGKGAHTTPYVITGTWPEFEVEFDCINPGTLGVVTWIMQFEGCSDSDVIEFVVLGGSRVTKVSTSLQTEAEQDCCEPFSSSSL
jgi:hypothetical protein